MRAVHAHTRVHTHTHDALSTHTAAFMLFSQERDVKNAILRSEACHRGRDHDPLEEVKHEEDCP